MPEHTLLPQNTLMPQDTIPTCALHAAPPAPPCFPTPRHRQSAPTLLPQVYDELRRLARARMARVGPGEMLTPTELVHETYLRLADGRRDTFEGRRHFFFAAARAMRDILVEAARRKSSLKRGGGTVQVSLEGAEGAVVAPRLQALDLDRALRKLEGVSPERARVVMLSFFGGLTHPEIGAVLGISRATVERRWGHARTWLRRELAGRRELAS